MRIGCIYGFGVRPERLPAEEIMRPGGLWRDWSAAVQAEPEHSGQQQRQRRRQGGEARL